MLEASNLECRRGDRRLFTNLNFNVPPGTFVQLSGPNGSGKTSLLRMICGLLSPTSGEILWQGANIRSLGEEYFRSISYVGHRHGLKEELTSAENLRIATGLAGAELNSKDCSEILERVGLTHGQHLPARLLSEGQRRRAALARLLTRKTALWLLDEVFTSLDKSAVAVVKELIEQHLTSGGMAIVATHQELNFSAGSFQRLELAS